jgi:integral membrane sensor domain MASE1
MNPVKTRALLESLAVAVAYVVLAEIGFSLAFTTKQVTAVWPPTGIAVAALLLCGYRVWPGILIGAFVSNAISHEPPLTAAAIAAGNTLAPIAGVAILRRIFLFDNAIERVRDAVGIVVVAAAAMTISASNGVLQLALAGIVPWSAYGSVWLVWWAGDTMGVMLVAPLILTIATPSHLRKRNGGDAEFLVFMMSLLAVTWLTFVSSYPYRLSLYPFIIWSALRFRQRETICAIVLIAAFAVYGAVHQLGALGTGTVDQRLVGLMSFLAVLAVTGLLLGSATAETARTNERLEAAESRLKNSLAQTTRVAETLQASFLPDGLPQRDNLRCDALYYPASTEALIGGDWYDAFERPDGSIVVSIGDVVGHGLTAAIKAGRIRQRILASATDSDDPATILEKLNRTLRASEDTLATALIAIFEPSQPQMRYASAGHPPPILASTSTDAGPLPIGGVPLGVGDAIDSRTRIVPLEAGSVVVFYTDGLTEFDRNIERAEHHLFDAVTHVARERNASFPASYVQQAVMGDRPPADDVVIVVVQIQG